MVAHSPQDFEDGFVWAGQPFGRVRAAVVYNAQSDVLDAVEAGHVVFSNVSYWRSDAVVLWWLRHR
jgi:hypothetical protein